jgi:5-methylcytosine-specific restriction endonuclease McrA
VKINARVVGRKERKPPAPAASECLVCSASVKPPVKLCSEACRAAQKRAYDAHYRASRAVEKYCACGQKTPSRTRHKCDACRESTKRRRKLYERKRSSTAFESEPYTLEEIAARDGHRCGLCRKPVPMDRSVPHPLAPTIDHLIPISETEGGDDVKANVQLAHFLCNSRRGTGGTVQLALVG